MSRLTDALDKRDAVKAKAEAIIIAASAEDRSFTPGEEAKRALFESQLEDIDAEITSARSEEVAAETAPVRTAEDIAAEQAAEDASRSAEAGDVSQRQQEAAAAARTATGTGTISGIVGPKTYFRGGPNNYMQDLMRRSADMATGRFDPESEHVRRLKAHAKEISVDAVEAQARQASGTNIVSRTGFSMDRYLVSQARAAMAEHGMSQYEASYRDLSTSAGSGGEFVPPIYLTEDYVPFARAGRVFANACHNEALPPGTMSINIPKIQGGTTVAPQGVQNTNVSDTDLQTEYVTFPVITVAGAQVLSLQLIERSPIDFTGVAFKDLAMAQAQAVDQQTLVGTGANSQVTGAINTAGINSVTWASGGTFSIIQNLFGAVSQAKADIATQRYMPPVDVFFTPGRWEWLEQLVDTNQRPLIVPMNNGPWNTAQVSPDMAIVQGATGGRLLGLNVWQDANIPSTLSTNQDAILVTKTDDLYLYETPVITRALPQTYGAQLSVLIQLYNYIAFTAARYPTSVSLITGAELVNPIVYNHG